MGEEVEEIEVNSQGLGLALALGLGWALITGLAWSQEIPWAPPWAGQALLALAPVVAVASVWSAVTRRVLVVSSQGLRLTRRPLALWDLAWVPRAELAFVALDERELHDSDGYRARTFWGKPRTAWAVVAHTRSGEQVTVADGYEDPQLARAVAERIRRVTGC
jgi:hypothetical protein